MSHWDPSQALKALTTEGRSDADNYAGAFKKCCMRTGLLPMQAGEVEEAEMFRTFNMGVGMLVVVDKSSVDAALSHDSQAFYLGEIVSGRGVHLM